MTKAFRRENVETEPREQLTSNIYKRITLNDYYDYDYYQARGRI